MDVGGQQGQIGVIAAVQRQFHDLLRVDDLAVLAGIRLERGGHAGDLNGVGYHAHLHRDIDALPCVDIHRDIRCFEFRKAGEFRRDLVSSHAYIEEIVIASTVSCGFCLNARVLVRQCHGNVRRGRACGVVNRSEDFAVSNCPNSKAPQSKRNVRTMGEEFRMTRRILQLPLSR